MSAWYTREPLQKDGGPLGSSRNIQCVLRNQPPRSDELPFYSG